MSSENTLNRGCKKLAHISRSCMPHRYVDYDDVLVRVYSNNNPSNKYT